LELTYGIQVQSLKDPYFELAESADDIACVILGKNHLVDMFPILRHVPRWMPGAGFQRYAAKARGIMQKALEEPMKATERDLVSGVVVNFYEILGVDTGGFLRLRG
jgi:hypothetical protein